jgi:hypothetical protein
LVAATKVSASVQWVVYIFELPWRRKEKGNGTEVAYLGSVDWRLVAGMWGEIKVACRETLYCWC